MVSFRNMHRVSAEEYHIPQGVMTQEEIQEEKFNLGAQTCWMVFALVLNEMIADPPAPWSQLPGWRSISILPQIGSSTPFLLLTLT